MKREYGENLLLEFICTTQQTNPNDVQKIESKLIKIVKISQIYLFFFFLLQAINKIVIIIILTMNNVSFPTVFSQSLLFETYKSVYR